MKDFLDHFLEEADNEFLEWKLVGVESGRITSSDHLYYQGMKEITNETMEKRRNQWNLNNSTSLEFSIIT